MPSDPTDTAAETREGSPNTAGPDADAGSRAATPWTDEPKDAPAGGGGNHQGNGGGDRETHRRRRSRWLLDWAIIVVLALAAAVLIRTYVFQTFFIPSASMEPTLHIGDRIVVDRLSYHIHTIGRGDIVVFRRPRKEDCGGPKVADLVKRVIGLPTETIQGKDGEVYITGKPLAEPWLPRQASSYTTDFAPIKIPRDDYFMMGDNRVDSCDSRDWGPLPRSYVVGKVVLRVWPLSRIHWF